MIFGEYHRRQTGMRHRSFVHHTANSVALCITEKSFPRYQIYRLQHFEMISPECGTRSIVESDKLVQ